MILPNLVLTALLAFAGWRDVVSRIIPDRIALLLAVIGIASRSTAGWTPLMFSIATAALLFAVLLVLAMRGLLGGGDVKLASALALGLSPDSIWGFVTATALAGGILGLGYIAGRHFAPRLAPAGPGRPLRRFLAIEARRLRRGGPLPYGVAIAIGGVITLFTQPGG